MAGVEGDLDAQIAKYESVASPMQREGGLPRTPSIVMLVLAFIGMLASLELIISEKQKLTQPDSSLLCDINSLIGCGKWVGAWQNEVFFGVSNSVLGLAFFSGITALALVLVTNGRLTKLMWQALCVAISLGVIWVVWFQYQSFVVEQSICPYCFVTWIVTIPLFVLIWGRTLQSGHWGSAREPLGRVIVRNSYVIVIAWYVLLFAFTLLWFWDYWTKMF